MNVCLYVSNCIPNSNRLRWLGDVRTTHEPLRHKPVAGQSFAIDRCLFGDPLEQFRPTYGNPDWSDWTAGQIGLNQLFVRDRVRRTTKVQ